MATNPLSPDKLRSLPQDTLEALVVRTTAVQARLLDRPVSELGRDVGVLSRFLSNALFQMEGELRRRNRERSAALPVEELDPSKVTEAA